MAARGETRSRMVSGTLRLLRRRGLHGTGLQEVLEETATPRGSLYFHFPGGKGQLVGEALALAGRRTEMWMRRRLDGSPSVADGVARMLEDAAGILEESGFAEGCPVAAVALDLGPEADALQAACGLAFDGWVEVVAEALRAEGRSAAEADALALTAVAAVEGGLVVCRARRDASALRALAASARALLNSPARPDR